MITFWRQEDGKLCEITEDALDQKNSTWVDARSVTRDDIGILEDRFGIDPKNILDILDPDELSRLEYNDDYGYRLLILRLPVFSPGEDISYFCAPLGIILKDNLFITVCWTDCEVLRDFSAGRIRDLKMDDFPAFAIRFLSRSDTAFLRYLKELNRRATMIQNQMLQSVHNNELIQLLNIQKSLVFFSTALKSNQMLLEKIRKTRIIELDDEDKDWLDDVEIDNRQAMEMTDTYTNIMATMNDAFAGVLGNNLNIVMKTMTGWNLVLMVPTIISSLYGINVPLPFQDSGWIGLIFVLVSSVLLSVMTYFIFMRRKLTAGPKDKKSVTKRGMNSFKKHRDTRRQLRLLKQMEKKAEETR